MKNFSKNIKNFFKKVNPLKKRKESEEKLIEQEKLNILHENIYRLLNNLKNSSKSIDKMKIYLMKKGQNVGFSEDRVLKEIINIMKDIEEYKMVSEIDREISSKKEHEIMRKKYEKGVYCPVCHAKIRTLPKFTTFKCEYCDTVFKY